MDASRTSGSPNDMGASDLDAPVLATLHTADLDAAQSFLGRLHRYPVKVQPVGRFDGLNVTSDIVQLGPITLGEISYGADLQIDADDLETAYHVLVPLTGAQQSRRRTDVLPLNRRRAGVYGPGGENQLNWPANCRLLSVRIDRAAFEKEIAVALGRHAPSPLSLGASFDVTTGPGRSWTSLVRLLYAELRDPDSLVRQPQMARRWWQLVLSGLALTVEHPYRADLACAPATMRPRPVKRALDAIHAAPGHPFTAPELAAIAGVGTRVLQEAFRRHVGMPPMTYLRELRLARVHHVLSKADPWETSVSEVAFRWGFTHLGRFAGAYRAKYGMPPSQTLREQP